MRSMDWKDKPRGELLLAVLDWLLDEQLAGRRPNDIDVAKQFGLDLAFVIDLHAELERMGELG